MRRAKVRLNSEFMMRLREKHEFKMASLHVTTGIGLRTLGDAVAGRPTTLRTAQAIADAVDRPLRDLLERGYDVDEYTAETLRNRLREGSYGSANCSAYLIGDYSVLLTKRAYMLPIAAKIHVCVEENTRTVVDLYVASGDHWVRDAELGGYVENGLRLHLTNKLLLHHFPWCPIALRIGIVSEVPAGFGIHEECALALALSEAIRRHCGRPEDPEGLETLLFAGALLSARYVDISWATLVASQHGTEPAEVWSFNRNNDGGIDLLDLYESNQRGADMEPNVYPGRALWNVVSQPQFDVNRVTVWWNEETLRAPQTSSGRHLIRKVPMSFVIDQIDAAAYDGAHFPQRFGMLMRMHQLMLASVDAVRPEVQSLIARISGLPGVLGAKLAAGRERGAIIVFGDHRFNAHEFQRRMKADRLRPLEDYLLRLDIDLADLKRAATPKL